MTKIGERIRLDDGEYEVTDRFLQEAERQNEKGETVYVLRSYGLAVRRVRGSTVSPAEKQD